MESDRLVELREGETGGNTQEDGLNLESNCDFVLVWEEKIEVESSAAAALRNLTIITQLKGETTEEADNRVLRARESFERNLEKDATFERIQDRSSESTITHYTLVTIKNQALIKYVHRRHMKLPIKDLNDSATSGSAVHIRKSLLQIDNAKYRFNRDVEGDEEGCCPRVNKYYNLPVVEMDADTLSVENVSSLLTHRQRQEIANYILMTTQYDDSKSEGKVVGLGCLLKSKVYKAAFCPHEYLHKSWNHSDGKCPNLRTFLYKHWANPKKIFVYQPINQIREYFGETVTFYFAWLGYYTFWLFPAALVGLCVFIAGIVFSVNDEYTDQICKTNLTLCPLCDVRCSAQNLSSQCVNSRVSRVFDYPGSIAYSLFMTLWAVLFLEFWKRRTCRLACEWDVLDYQSAEEPSRPEIINYRATHRRQRHQREIKFIKMGFSIIAIAILVIFVLSSVTAVILYRLWIRMVLVENFGIVTFGLFFASISAALLSVIFTMIFAPLYHRIATKLTDLELHEHQSSYERSLALKLFCFSFVNFFSSTIYVAFFMGRFMGMPGRLEKWFGVIPPEACTGQDCVFDLTKHIMTFLLTKIFVDNFNEHALPVLIPYFKACIGKLTNKGEDRVESDGKHEEVRLSSLNARVDQPTARIIQLREDLEKAPYDTSLLFGEYLEMVLQFGFVVMFGAACPLIALLALINNMVELRLDAKKLVRAKRRPVASRAQNIGVWEQALTGMLLISIMTNGCYIAFTTDFIQRQIYKNEYSVNNSMDGYLDYKLVNSTYIEDVRLPNGTEVPGNESVCFFFAEKHNPKVDYYYFLAIRLTFVLLFENFAVALVQILRFMIPNEPAEVLAHINKESEELEKWHERHGSRSSKLLQSAHQIQQCHEAD